MLFCTCLTTTETIFPSILLLDRALKNASVSVSKVHSIPHCGGNFPKDVILFPPFLTLKHPQSEAHACTHTLHACMRAYVLYLSLCWANTPLCLTCFLCHDDERHLLFSAETPLHPMLLTSCLHYSQVEWLLSHFSERLNFCDMGWSEVQDSRVGSMISGNLSQSQEDCGGFYSHFVLTLWNVNIILPVHFQISLLLQTAGNNFFFFLFLRPVT